MGTPSNKQRYPSLEEFRGWYNLGYERPDGIPVLHSRDDVPEFEHGEFFHLYLAENKWFEELVPKSEINPFDPVADAPIFLKGDADDRTLEVYPDFRYVTIEMIRRIQRECLGRHPLWRVMLMSYEPSCTIVIYPNVVRFGNSSLEVDADLALRSILPRAVMAQEVLLRPRRIQVEFLKERLPKAVLAIGNREFVVIGVLDDGSRGQMQLFLFLQGADDCAFEVRASATPDELQLARSGGFGIDRSGAIISRIEIPDTAAYCVARWYLPADYRGPLTITSSKTGEAYVFELTTAGITRTASLE